MSAEFGSFCAPLRSEDATEEIYATFDPGIVGVVRALHRAGFVTTDSGDGKHKGTIGWDPMLYGDIPHVTVDDGGDVAGAGIALGRWAKEHGLDVEVQAFLIPHDDGYYWSLLVAGDPLYGWQEVRS